MRISPSPLRNKIAQKYGTEWRINMDFTRMKEMMDREAGKLFPGLDMCIYQKGKEVFRYQAGYDDIEKKTPVNPKALYYLFSCSKPITCTAAMQLYEKGYFVMEEPVSKYLPEFKEMCLLRFKPNGEADVVKAQNPITIKQLFTMTSGIDYNLDTWAIREIKERTGGKCPTKDIVEAIALNPLTFEPGTHYRYGLNHDVLGRLIEVLTGMSFGEYLQENIFKPCGMKHTGFRVTPEIKAQMPVKYLRNAQTDVFEKGENICEYRMGEESEYESGGAGLVSCVDDYILFAAAMANKGMTLGGDRILSERTVDVMRTNALTPVQLADYSKYAEGYGYGFGVRTFLDSGIQGRMSNPGEFGWDGAAGCFVLIDPKEELALFCAQNVRNPFNALIQGRITSVLYSTIH